MLLISSTFLLNLLLGQQKDLEFEACDWFKEMGWKPPPIVIDITTPNLNGMKTWLFLQFLKKFMKVYFVMDGFMGKPGNQPTGGFTWWKIRRDIQLRRILSDWIFVRFLLVEVCWLEPWNIFKTKFVCSYSGTVDSIWSNYSNLTEPGPPKCS